MSRRDNIDKIVVEFDYTGMVLTIDSSSLLFPIVFDRMEHYWMDYITTCLDIVQAIAYDVNGDVVAVVNNRV